MGDQRKLDRKTIERMALVIHSAGYSYSEAYPERFWNEDGWPAGTEELYGVLDSILKYFRMLEKYGIRVRKIPKSRSRER